MKPWAEELDRHIETWSARLGPYSWWPHFVYHFTDIHNAVQILQSCCLYSRNAARRLELMKVDNASPEIIGRTAPAHLNYVRLYFRPRTPTQYRNEGIRPILQRELGGAHCPVPIFFCFDAKTVLARDDSLYSDGNMGSGRVQSKSDRDFFFSIPFQYVFHNVAFTPDERDTIIFHRNAEVLVPDQLPLDPALRFIGCRSAAELQTLLHLLPANVRRQWESRIRLGEQGLFERRWTYVEEVVTTEDDRIIFRFNPNTRTPGPFQVKVTYEELESDRVRIWEGTVEKLNDFFDGTIANPHTANVTLELDDSLAFAGTVLFDELPF